jgi:hypothetical protein
MAPPKQLRCADLLGGDIMLQFNQGNVAGKAIAFGQAMAGDKNTEIVHAGVLFDNHYMVEALDKGISAGDLRTQNKAFAYRVYRSRQPMLGATAANVVKFLFDHHQNNGTLPYSYVGAVTSLGAAKPMSASHVDKLMDDILSLKPAPFYCSQFVVMSYQLAAAQLGMSASSVFGQDDTQMPPARLASACEHSVAFDCVGFVSPNER